MGDKEFSFRHIAFEVLAGPPRERPTKEVRNGIHHLENGDRGTEVYPGEVVTGVDEAARNSRQSRRGLDRVQRTPP